MRIGSIKLRKPLDEILKGRIEVFNFEVGILKDGPHRRAGKGLKNYAGGPARKTGRKIDGTLSQVSKNVRQETGINYLTLPWKKKNSDIIKFMKSFIKLAFGEDKLKNKKRVENLVQAVVRNPIMRGAYGVNKKLTATIKGFNRKFIDTAQMFRAITARVRIKAKGK